jgi:hypothetical protein
LKHSHKPKIYHNIFDENAQNLGYILNYFLLEFANILSDMLTEIKSKIS